MVREKAHPTKTIRRPRENRDAVSISGPSHTGISQEPPTTAFIAEFLLEFIKFRECSVYTWMLSESMT